MKELNVGLLGCGTVGTGVVKILQTNLDAIQARLGVPVHVRRIAVSNPEKERDPDVSSDLVTGDAEAVLSDPDIHIVVEVIGGVEPARTLILDAMGRGKHVVTANKALLAQHGSELFNAASAGNVDLFFEASVCGGIPIIRSLREGLASDQILRLYGIVNGTSNFLLTALSDGAASFDDVVAEAQELGYAEADPSMDVDGVDAAQKLAILIALAFGVRIPFADIHTEGIRSLEPIDFLLAEEFGYAIKPLAIAKASAAGVEARVQPTLIPIDSLLASVHGAFNAVYVESLALGPAMFYGQGAGMMPTAASVVSDIIEVGRNVLQGTSGRIPHLAFETDVQQTHAPHAQIECEFYCRLAVEDEPGVLAQVALVLADEGISVRQVLQTEATDTSGATLALFTHAARQGSMSAALSRIDEASYSRAKTQFIRIERP